MRKRANLRMDGLFLLCLIILIVTGLVVLFSASQPAGVQRFGDGNYFIKRQILYGLLPGLIFATAIFYLGLERLKKLTWVIYIFSIVLLALVFVPGIGVTINHSRSWLSLFGFGFQPAEFAKLAVVCALAAMLSRPKYNWFEWQTGILPALAILGPILLLVALQPDFGTLVIIGGEILGVLIIANIPRNQLMTLFVVGLVGAVIFIFAGSGYRLRRIEVFLHPEKYPVESYQVNQAFVAAGSGGLTGFGLWNSRQKYQYLPEASADTIFAILAEELGFWGASLMIVLILLLVMRGLKISKWSTDQYGSLLAAGIMIWFGWQSFLNIGSTVGAIPLTGVPLPFVSHGGSALAMAIGAAACVLIVSKETNHH
ncbi:MAG: putative peptidoglycan glycosyltransferase FtsW [Patescibacteria group bacterium]|jgi:cell division protein FtsW